MISFYLPHDSFKHLAAICKNVAKNKEEFTSSIHIVVRHGIAFIAACDGHICGIFKRGLVRGDHLDGCFSIGWQDVSNLADLKIKPTIEIKGYPDENLTVEGAFYKCEAKKNDCHSTMADIIAKAVEYAESGELVPSPAAHIVRRDSYKLAFYGKGYAYHLYQPSGKPCDMQLCISNEYPYRDYMAIVMPLKSDDSEEGRDKVRDLVKSFFEE